MDHVSQGFRECLQADPWLLAAWKGLLLSAWAAGSWVALAGTWLPDGWPTGPESGLRLLAWLLLSAWLLHGWRHPPAGFVLNGRLAWSGGHAELVPVEGVVRRGPVTVRWQSPLLVGVSIEDPAAGALVVWLTPRRLGRRGWWRLQRFMLLAGP